MVMELEGRVEAQGRSDAANLDDQEVVLVAVENHALALQEAFPIQTFGSGDPAAWELVPDPRNDWEVITFTDRGARAGMRSAKANRRVLSGRAKIFGCKLVTVGPRTGRRTVHAVILVGLLSSGVFGIGRIHALASAPSEEIQEGRPQLAIQLRKMCGARCILALAAEDRHDDSFNMLGLEFAELPSELDAETVSAIADLASVFGFANVLGRTYGRPPVFISRNALALSPANDEGLQLKSVKAVGAIQGELPGVGSFLVGGEADFERRKKS